MYKLTRFEKYRNFVKVAVFFFCLIASMSTFSSDCFSHAVFLSAHVEGDMIFVEGGFSDGTYCKNAKITVLDPEGNKLLEGKTNEEGTFSFSPPQKIDLKVVLDAGMGHRDEYTIPAGELPAVLNATVASTETAPIPDTNPNVQMPSEEIEAVVDKVIQERLRPLTQIVAKLERNRRVSVGEVFGGIGYIIGLMGIAMYFKSRKGREN
ncbi:hypothetical protein [uncultured Desulfosarcina sp.]|uniref:hypothetical protein n=1 Tax=uncultured Desulfosarcina sp. TaxID=218289 RepID=UPI0029C65B97|nr:hypothetical protein [uncultured Desulfosarcina sp.]